MVLKAEAWDVNMLERMGVAVRLSLTFRLLAGLDRFHLDQARPGPTVELMSGCVEIAPSSDGS